MFGMGTGGTPPPLSPGKTNGAADAAPCIAIESKSHENSVCAVRESARPISTGKLNTLLCLHLRPIYLVVYQGPYSSKLVETCSWGRLRA